MPLVPFNSVGGYSTGITGTIVIDAAGNVFATGLSASGGTFSTDISVNGMRVGRGVSNISTNLAIGASAYNSGVTGFNNLGIGLNAVRDNTTGDANLGIGVNALASNTRGRANTAIGVAALQTLNSATAGVGLAEYNVAIGSSALQNSTTASYNMAIGTSSLSNNTTGGENVAIGTFALIRNNTGNDNIAIGHQALGPGFASPNALTENISIGYNSLFNTNTTSRNTAIGAEVGFRNTTGALNTLIGRRALYNNATGSNNTAIGAQAGEFAGTAGATLQSSTNSVLIGYLAASGNTTSSNEIVIGANAVGLGSNTAVIGATAQTSTTIYGTIQLPTGGISASGGFTFGSPSGTTFMVFRAATALSGGGLWMRDGVFQIGGSALASVLGAFSYNPNNERFYVFGNSDFNNSYNYQSDRAALRLNAAPTQSVPILAAYKQTSDGTQLSSGFTATNMVAGIDRNGALFSNAGISASGGITFNSNVTISSPNSLNTRYISSSVQSGDGELWIGDWDGSSSNTFIYLRPNAQDLSIFNPLGQISIGDRDGYDTGNYIYFYAAENRLSSDTNSSISGFSTIEATSAFYETANQIRVTNNARSWFL
jgi:hypothetical protein